MRPIGKVRSDSRLNGTMKVRPKFMIVSEGHVTEPRYFQALAEHREVSGISDAIDVVVLQRERFDAGVSDPVRMVDLLDDYMEALRSGRHTLNLMIEQMCGHLPSPDPELRQIAKERCASMADKEGFVKDPGAVFAVLAQMCSEYYGKEIEGEPEELPDYREDIDRICVVIDRDRDNRGAGKMDEFLRRCARSGYAPYISNPCFELWLLMHFDEYDAMDRSKLLRNPMHGTKRFTESELDRILHDMFNRGYKKTSFDAITFLQRTDEAISRSMSSCVDPYRLKSELGTNVGLLVKDLKDGADV